MLEYAVSFNGPIAIRYPKGKEDNNLKCKKISYGKCEIIRNGKDITILAIGKMVGKAYVIASMLNKDGIDTEIINARFLKPLDVDAIKKSFSKTNLLITIEDNDMEYGLGASIKKYLPSDKILSLGYPDIFLPQGTIDEIEKKYHLDNESIYLKIINFINKNKRK